MKNKVNKTKDNPKLIERFLKDGRISLRLEYYNGDTTDPSTGKRKQFRSWDNLGLYLVGNPRTPLEREQNRAILELALNIRIDKEREFKKKRGLPYLSVNTKNINFWDYFTTYRDNYKLVGSVSKIRQAYNRFKRFLKECHPYYVNVLVPNCLTRELMEEFVSFNESLSKGHGAQTVFRTFSRMLKAAVCDKILETNPCIGIKVRVLDGVRVKEFLTFEELDKLESTTLSGKYSVVVCRAFLFCCYTAIRYGDVKRLRYKDIDFKTRKIRFKQGKTGKMVEQYLHDKLLSYVCEAQNNDDYVFALPSPMECCRLLNRWANLAGIDKYLSFHCSRHTALTNMGYIGLDSATAMSISGHTTLDSYAVYLHTDDARKAEAASLLANHGKKQRDTADKVSNVDISKMTKRQLIELLTALKG
jgi:integrase